MVHESAGMFWRCAAIRVRPIYKLVWLMTIGSYFWIANVIVERFIYAITLYVINDCFNMSSSHVENQTRAEALVILDRFGRASICHQTSPNRNLRWVENSSKT